MHSSLKEVFRLRLLAISSLALLITGIISLSPAHILAAGCQAPSPSYGIDTISSVNVPVTGTYTVWVRINAPSSSSSTILLQIDSANCYNVGGSSSIPTNSWTWVDYQNGNTGSTMQPSLSSGPHTFELLGNESGISVDSILLLEGSNCVPTGSGSNCTQTTSVPVTTTPQSTTSNNSSNSSTTVGTSSKSSKYQYAIPKGVSAALSGTSSSTPVAVNAPVTLGPALIPGYTVKEVQYYLNNKLIYTATKAPFTYKLDPNTLLNGQYKLTSVTTYTNGRKVTVNHVIKINHPFWKETGLYISHNIIYIVVVLFIVALCIWLVHNPLMKYMKNRINNKPNDPNGPSDPTPPGPNIEEQQIIQPTNIKPGS
jgi:hypothetical protein